MSAYYNEIEPYAAQWLRNLIQAGHIAAGEVDERSIEDVHPADIREFTQCHFFAGIGIWSHALRRAGWPDERPVWTGSCPCQPFSAAGKGAGFADERHLWPAWQHLIKECCPAIVFGEQVASKDVDPWIDLVQADLEAMGYAVGAVPFPAAGVGAPHIRDRLYFVAEAMPTGRAERRAGAGLGSPAGSCSAGVLADLYGSGRPPRGEGGQTLGHREAAGPDCGAVRGFWVGAEWLDCRDGKARPIEPGTFPLVAGAPGRVGRLRAYGNGICAPQAQAWIETVMEAMP